MYYVALCDDNVEFLNMLSDMLEKEFGEIVSPKYKIAFEKFNSGRSLLDFAKKQKISVLFLDIDMPEMTGFDVAKVLGNENKDMLIICVSAYDNFVSESLSTKIRANYLEIQNRLIQELEQFFKSYQDFQEKIQAV